MQPGLTKRITRESSRDPRQIEYDFGARANARAVRIIAVFLFQWRL
jgi:hypothetical protein